MNDTIKLYPSNWLYNASVIGFLRVLEHGIGEEEVNKCIQDDGTVLIDKTIIGKLKDKDSTVNLPSPFDNLTNLSYWYIKKSYEFLYDDFLSSDDEFIEIYKKVVNKRLFGQVGFYTNLVTLFSEKKPDGTVKSLNEKMKWLTYLETSKSKIQGSCSMCNDSFVFKKSEFHKLGFKNRYFAQIGGAIPNYFWNCEPSLYLCPRCALLLIYRHLAFIKIPYQEIFFNGMTFKLMWNLNKYANATFKQSKAKNIFALGLLEFSQRITTKIGMWTTFNIEMITMYYDYEKKRTVIDHNSIPHETSKILMNKNISYLITKSNDPFILDTVLSGKYDNLLKLCNSAMRSIISGNINSYDSFISKLRLKNMKQMKNLADILPELYIRIDHLNQEV